jgi:hypothetical protein
LHINACFLFARRVKPLLARYQAGLIKPGPPRQLSYL